jgi:flagellar hook-length control protein FliK
MTGILPVTLSSALLPSPRSMPDNVSFESLLSKSSNAVSSGTEPTSVISGTSDQALLPSQASDQPAIHGLPDVPAGSSASPDAPVRGAIQEEPRPDIQKSAATDRPDEKRLAEKRGKPMMADAGPILPPDIYQSAMPADMADRPVCAGIAVLPLHPVTNPQHDINVTLPASAKSVLQLIQSGPVTAKPSHSQSIQDATIALSVAPDSAMIQDHLQPVVPAAFQQQPASISPAVTLIPSSSALPAPHLAMDSGWIDSLARDIAASASTDGKLNFRLVPEYLGKLDIALAHVDGALDIAMKASTDVAAAIIVAEQPRFIEELRQSGLKIGNFEMTSGQQGSFARQQQSSSPNMPLTMSPPLSVLQKTSPSSKRNNRFA